MLPFNALLSETQYFSKVLKLISWKSYGGHIYYLIFNLAIFELNLIIFHIISNEVILDGMKMVDLTQILQDRRLCSKYVHHSSSKR